MPGPVCGIVLSLNCALAALASVAAGAGPYQELSLEKATEVAAMQGKRVAVVFVTSDKFSSCMDDALALPALEGWRSNQVVLVRVEIEKERTAARLLGVTSVPTLVLAGPSPQSWVGCPDAGRMEEWAASIAKVADETSNSDRGRGSASAAEVDQPSERSSPPSGIQFKAGPGLMSGAVQKQILAMSGIHSMINQQQYAEATKSLVDLCQTMEVPKESGWNGNRLDVVFDSFPFETIELVCESHPAARAEFVGMIESLERRLHSGDTSDAVLKRWVNLCGVTRQNDRLNQWHDRLIKIEGRRDTLTDIGNVWLLRSLASAGRWKEAAALFDRHAPSVTESRQFVIESQLRRGGKFDEIKLSPNLHKDIRQWADDVGIRVAALWALGGSRSGHVEMLIPRVEYKMMKDAALLAAVRHAMKANVLTRSRLNLIADIDTDEAALLRAEAEKDLESHKLK